jgi:hypothetical protein
MCHVGDGSWKNVIHKILRRPTLVIYVSNKVSQLLSKQIIVTVTAIITSLCSVFRFSHFLFLKVTGETVHVYVRT